MVPAFKTLCRIGIFSGLSLLGSVPFYGQQLDLPEGPVGNAKFDRPISMGLSQSLTVGTNALTAGVPFYTDHYLSLGVKALPFNIIGTNPALGPGTTVVPVTIVPLKVVFASTGVTLDGTNVAPATVNSPLFLTADYTIGGTDIGVTQYGDAIQRAEFWNLNGFSQAGYHVLLGTPTIAATVTINVPVGKGNTYGAGALGVVDNTFFDAQLNALISGFTPGMLPIFLTDNVFEGTNGLVANCCVLGYHASQGPPIATAQTWIYAAYTESGTFAGNAILDVQPLSHEVAEWLNDPFVGTPLLGGINLVAPAVLGGGCIINFETGDPLESPPVVFTKTTNGKLYHLQDEAFLSWYLHGPSFGVNGLYSYLGTFTTPSTLCGPG